MSALLFVDLLMLAENKVVAFGVEQIMENNKNQVQSRPDIQSLKITDNISEEENFQNRVLRPIIKMKHEMLIAHFKNYIASNKLPWKELGDTRKIDFIETAFTRDLAFRNEVRGLVIGQFTLET